MFLEEFVVRYNNKKFMTYSCVGTALIICLFLYRPYNPTNHGWLETFFMVTFFGTCLSFFWFLALDKRPKLKISKEGLWSKKTGNLSWDELWYFSLDEEKTGRGENLKYLYIKLSNNEIEYKIDISNFDKTKTEIHDAMEKFSSKYKIIDLGYSNDF